MCCDLKGQLSLNSHWFCDPRVATEDRFDSIKHVYRLLATGSTGKEVQNVHVYEVCSCHLQLRSLTVSSDVSSYLILLLWSILQVLCV